MKSIQEKSTSCGPFFQSFVLLLLLLFGHILDFGPWRRMRAVNRKAASVGGIVSGMVKMAFNNITTQAYKKCHTAVVTNQYRFTQKLSK